MDSYRGFKIPTCMKESANRAKIAEVLTEGKGGCLANAGPLSAGCSHISCGECILDMDEHGRRGVLFEYLSSLYPGLGTFPQRVVRAGMLLRMRDGAYYYCIGECSFAEVIVEYSPCSAPRLVVRRITEDIDWDKVSAVWWRRDAKNLMLTFDDLIALMGDLRGKSIDGVESWERPEPVREMTLDEISKELGYEVKVVSR